MCDESFSNVFYSKNISWILLDDDVFVIDEIADKTYILKNLSKELWLLIQKNKNLIDIIHQLAERYDDDFVNIKNNIIKLVVKFSKNNLVVWSDVV